MKQGGVQKRGGESRGQERHQTLLTTPADGHDSNYCSTGLRILPDWRKKLRVITDHKILSLRLLRFLRSVLFSCTSNTGKERRRKKTAYHFLFLNALNCNSGEMWM